MNDTADNNVEFREVASLRTHSLHKRLPLPQPDDPSYDRVRASVASVGILEPLKVTAAGEVVDGVLRFRAAKSLGLKEVPTVQVEGTRAASIIVHTLLGRRHYLMGQLAYLLEPLSHEAFEEGKRRQSEMLARQASLGGFPAETSEQWAERHGLSLRLLVQARQIRRHFEDETKRTLTDQDGRTEKNVTFREFFEPRLMRPVGGEEKPYGLGAIIAGISSHLATAGKKSAKLDGDNRQLELFTEAFGVTLRNRLKYWEEFDDSKRERAEEVIRKTFQDCPTALLKSIERLAGSIRRRQESGAI